MAKTLPRNGSDESVLEPLLSRIAVWRILLLFGTMRDEYTEADIARRLNRMLRPEDHVRADQVTTLYHLAAKSAAAQHKAA